MLENHCIMLKNWKDTDDRILWFLYLNKIQDTGGGRSNKIYEVKTRNETDIVFNDKNHVY